MRSTIGVHREYQNENAGNTLISRIVILTRLSFGATGSMDYGDGSCYHEPSSLVDSDQLVIVRSQTQYNVFWPRRTDLNLGNLSVYFRSISQTVERTWRGFSETQLIS